MIANPSPIQATFGGMWITKLHILPSHVINATMQPFDAATGHLLATGEVHARAKADNQTVAPVIASIRATIARLSGNQSDLRLVNVSAPAPSQPVRIMAAFESGPPYIIRDAFALAATDQDFAATLQATMAEVATIANLSVQP
jgi:hypothetical protein